jgi:riboflavin kinase/FMN adenylyltransferase
MQKYEHFNDMPKPVKGSVLTIGSFDGLHCGHQLLIKKVVERARKKDLLAAVMTFFPHPAKILAPKFSPPLIMSSKRKVVALSSMGLDLVTVQKFDDEFAALSAEEFVQRVLVDKFAAKHIVVGDDFTFGKSRQGTVKALKGFGKSYGFGVQVVERLDVEGMIASSTRIRSFVLQGKVRGAAMLLGYPFCIVGRVVTGEGRGSQLGYPTANVKTDAELLPAYGVYVCHVWVVGKKGCRLGVCNVGTCPTFGTKTVSVEVHLLEETEDLVEKKLVVGFMQRIRGEVTFPSAEALVEQIGKDVEETRLISKEHKMFPRPPVLVGVD